MNWKDEGKYIFQVGDHNCTHREEDSINNPKQHKQAGLIHQMKIMGLKDSFVQYFGETERQYSRVTNISATRIDLILSNTKSCKEFKYIDPRLNFDHKMAWAEFEIHIESSTEYIPKSMKVRNWVISNEILKNEIFNEKVNELISEKYAEWTHMYRNGENMDVTLIWKDIKEGIKLWAQNIELSEKHEQKKRLSTLEVKYIMAMDMTGNGSEEQINSIKKELNNIYKKKSAGKVNKMRNLEINNQVYDIQKLQREKKFENDKKINEIKIGEKIYKGTVEAVWAIQKEMEKEMKAKDNLRRDEVESEEELHFLDKIPTYSWTQEDIQYLTKPVSSKEIGKY